MPVPRERYDDAFFKPLAELDRKRIGEVYLGLDDLSRAADCYAEARDICREIGGYGEGHALHNLGHVQLRLHQLDDAESSIEEAVRKHRAAGDLRGEGPATATQVWPAGSPYRLPDGPAAPASARAQVVLSRSRTRCASIAA